MGVNNSYLALLCSFHSPILCLTHLPSLLTDDILSEWRATISFPFVFVFLFWLVICCHMTIFLHIYSVYFDPPVFSLCSDEGPSLETLVNHPQHFGSTQTLPIISLRFPHCLRSTPFLFHALVITLSDIVLSNQITDGERNQIHRVISKDFVGTTSPGWWPSSVLPTHRVCFYLVRFYRNEYLYTYQILWTKTLKQSIKL